LIRTPVAYVYPNGKRLPCKDCGKVHRYLTKRSRRKGCGTPAVVDENSLSPKTAAMVRRTLKRVAGGRERRYLWIGPGERFP
jgi:hypothetical protein